MMQDNRPQNKKRLGLALGGGGVRGLAHVGVLKVLAKAGLQASLIAGTSMGGIIGAMYAAGLAPAQIEEEILGHTHSAGIRRLIDIRPSYRGFVRGERILNLLADAIGRDLTFSDLDLPLALVAVDGLSGREVILDKGIVTEAVRASISVPGIFQPVERDNMILIDGGILNNVPADIARKMGATMVIAVDVMPDFSRNTPGEPLVEPPIDPPSLPSFLQEALHIEYIMISALTSCRLQAYPPDVLVQPQISPEIDLLIGFDRAEEIIEAGEHAATEALPQILAQYLS